MTLPNEFEYIDRADENWFIQTGMPKWMYRDTEGKVRGCVTGISGPAIKPLALRSVAEVASAVRVPVSAIGGITTWQIAVEFMMLGATTVQIGIAAINFGYGYDRQGDGMFLFK